MFDPSTIQSTIRDNYSKIAGSAGVHNRFRSWEHCYGFFRKSSRTGIAAQRNDAALQLGFYLASWGMYRGSSFLLQYDYTIHLGVVACLTDPQFEPLWENEFGTTNEDNKLKPIIHAAITSVKEAYSPFGNATDTLVTKVILGTFGCLPACDRYFRDGFKWAGFKYSCLNEQLVDRVLRFCRDHIGELQHAQAGIKSSGGLHYPLMKLVDMYFWQVGYTLESKPSMRLRKPTR